MWWDVTYATTCPQSTQLIPPPPKKQHKHHKTPKTPKQAAHYFHTYLQLTKSDPAWDAIPSPSTTTTTTTTTDTIPPPLPRIAFAIPTGAAGHVTAGVIAALMGLPVAALVMATNEVGVDTL